MATKPEWVKPGKCADCGAPHPAFSRDGADGPWRCMPCDAVAQPKPVEDPMTGQARLL